MKKITTAILLLLAGYFVQCQPTRSPMATWYTAVGTYSKNFTDAFSCANNQAALAQLPHASAGAYAERRFMLKELSNFSAAIALPTRLGGFGVAAKYFGGEHFNTAQAGLGYGKKLSGKIDIGIQFNYNSISIAGYGSDGTINFEAGTLLHLTDKLHLGIHLYNPAGGKFGKLKSEKLSSVYTTGLGYEASPQLFISMAVSKEEDHAAGIQAALQYGFAGHFFSRMGIATATGNYFFGLGLQWKTCRLDVATNWQAQLGFTPALMLLFNFQPPAQQTEN